MSPGLFRPDMPLQEQLLSRKLVHDLLLLKGLGPGGHHHQFTPPGLLNLTFHPDAVAVGEPDCAGGCATAEACHSKEACMLCRSCRSEWQNGVLRRVMAEHLGECVRGVCAGGCAVAVICACHSKEACMLCRMFRSVWWNGVLQRVMAEDLSE